MTLEIISRENVKLLEKYLPQLFELSKEIIPQVRWHVADIFGRVEKYSKEELKRIISTLSDYLKDKSMIVRVETLEALSNIAQREKELKREIISKIEALRKDKNINVRKRVERIIERLK